MVPGYGIAILPLGGSFGPGCPADKLGFFHWVEVLPLGAWVGDQNSSTGWKCLPLGAWVHDCNSSTGWKFWACVPCLQIGILPLGGSFPPWCLVRGSEFFHWVGVFAPGCLGMRLQFFHCVEVLGLGALPEIGILPLGGSFPPGAWGGD